jgi:transposase
MAEKDIDGRMMHLKKKEPSHHPMLGHKPREFKTHRSITLEELVPAGHFYRKVEAGLDLTFARDLTRSCYSRGGRRSIDPVVFFKLELIMFFEGIRSERQLMETVKVNLAHRWFIGYDLDEPVPDHSALSKIRDRYGLDVFQEFFERIVEQCVAAGLVWGKELYFDGTRVRANADFDKRVPRFHWEARQHLSRMFMEQTSTQNGERGFVRKYNGQRLLGPHSPRIGERMADTHVCPTDPDATPLFGPGNSRLGCTLHYVVDGGKARVILAALVTASFHPGQHADAGPGALGPLPLEIASPSGCG